jgi:L-rhamnose mutarotase
MVNGSMYAPTPHQIDFHIQMALAANLDMYLWHADVSNAFAEAERRKQMYYMRRDAVFRDWWKRMHPYIPLPPDAVVPVLNNLQGHPEGPLIWAVR